MIKLPDEGINSFKDIFQTTVSDVEDIEQTGVSIPLRIYFKLAIVFDPKQVAAMYQFL